MNLWYLLLIVPALLTWYAQARVKRVYGKHSEEENGLGATGREIAQALLDRQGLDAVTIEQASGRLGDHYEPQRKTLRLTDGVADGRSVTAASIVGHEVGHAVQDAEGYRFMRLRTRMSGVVGRVAQGIEIVPDARPHRIALWVIDLTQGLVLRLRKVAGDTDLQRVQVGD